MSEEQIKEMSELTVTLTDGNSEDCMSFMGGDSRNPSWDEYKADFKNEYHPHLEALKKWLIDNGWVGKTGEDVCNYYGFKFSDGTHWTYSWRAWGDLMQAIVNKREGYMKYYM